MKTLMSLAILAAVSFGTAHEASAQVVEVEVAPPAAYIASVTPEYYENRPVYFYNNSWYYRDHGRWLYYRHEPGYLAGRRAYWGGPHGGYRGGYVRPGYYGGGARYHYGYRR
jgi:hypothetical protein